MSESSTLSSAGSWGGGLLCILPFFAFILTSALSQTSFNLCLFSIIVALRKKKGSFLFPMTQKDKNSDFVHNENKTLRDFVASALAAFTL